MTYRPLTLITVVSLAGLAVFLGVLQSLFTPTAARALTGDGHGPGYLSSDGWWLGAYHFDDGALGFCLHPGKKAPTGIGYRYADASEVGGWTPEQSAVFAYIARTWAGSGDRMTAAAGQLATWMHAGLPEAEARDRARRAGADADAVYARALEMVAEASSRASTGVRAAVVVELAETGPGRVRVELTVDRITGPELLPAGAHPVSVTLDGADFDDGGSTATIRSGTDVAIRPTGTEASVAVSAAATAGDLPYGNRITVALPTTDAQAVLIAQPSTASARAEAHVTGPSPLPFQPRVGTQTSLAEAHPGADIADHLTVSVDAGDGLLPTWGVRSGDDGFTPVAAVVESTLHGPFADPIVRTAGPPDGSPTVCTVETVIDGVGEYTTPTCTLPADGYYVWTERIDPARTETEGGGMRLRPWTSEFGIATEITRATTPAIPLLDAGPALAQTRLADTGADTLPPALWGSGAGAAGVLLMVAGRVRARRARRPRGRRAALEGAFLDPAAIGRPGRRPRVTGRQNLRPRRARSTWVAR
ncbi:hypothetical protein [Leifsonia soli]|uniref:Uncharacterized protein n=1 Tax=Leifsonia soli TaxID=582665 RepID=A0A852T0V9_9MICO|nr:hypothetical protein [Leifsonia soli]NYD74374.1 hypothetical protein [Leifsonia soli]